MGKARQKKKVNDVKRKQMIAEVFKKGKKQREVAKKFDDKIAQKQGSTDKWKDKFKQMKRQKKSEGNFTREHVAELNKKLDTIRSERKL